MEIGASAASLFGGSGASPFGVTSGSDILATGNTQSQEAARATITAERREINRIRGYKLDLTPADNQRLAKLKVQIQEIEQRVQQGIARPDELKDRADYFKEADEIIGKPIVDVEADKVLADLAGGIETLLAPKLQKPIADQVERLERVKQGLVDRYTANPDNRTLSQQLQSVSQTIDKLAPLRSVKELSPAEARAYDDLVTLINDHAGAKVELTVKEAKRVEELQKSISTLQASLPPDASQQPTANDVARAYTRLSL